MDFVLAALLAAGLVYCLIRALLRHARYWLGP